MMGSFGCYICNFQPGKTMMMDYGRRPCSIISSRAGSVQPKTMVTFGRRPGMTRQIHLHGPNRFDCFAMRKCSCMCVYMRACACLCMRMCVVISGCLCSCVYMSVVDVSVCVHASVRMAIAIRFEITVLKVSG